MGLLNARAGRASSRRTESRAAKTALALPERPDLVNRVPELAEAGGKLRGGGRVLAIEGEVGVGKSAAATELAYQLQDGDRRRGGQRRSFLWIDCDYRCPTLTR